MKQVFACQCCGHCCQGQGGILLTSEQLGPAAALLGLDAEAFRARYTAPMNGRHNILSDEDGYCLLTDREKGTCRIHAAKPDICRAWPFFPAMLRDRAAFEEAKDACPGLRADATWEEFCTEHAAAAPAAAGPRA